MSRLFDIVDAVMVHWGTAQPGVFTFRDEISVDEVPDNQFPCVILVANGTASSLEEDGQEVEIDELLFLYYSKTQAPSELREVTEALVAEIRGDHTLGGLVEFAHVTEQVTPAPASDDMRLASVTMQVRNWV